IAHAFQRASAGARGGIPPRLSPCMTSRRYDPRAATHHAPLAGRGRERSGRLRGDSRRARLVENPPHPAPSAPTSPRKRGEATEFAARSEINLDTETKGTTVTA